MVVNHVADSKVSSRDFYIDNSIHEQIKQMKLCENVDFCNEEVVKRYNKKINYNCGMTEHYEDSRVFRKKELVNILGDGERVDAFLIKDRKGNEQIQEILSNGIMIAYSHKTHKRVTAFAMHPDRICSLYASVGEFAPKELLKISEYNLVNGYNTIMRD